MKTFFNMSPWMAQENRMPIHTHHMGACAPCEAMRRQKEANEEFRRRYGLVDLNRPHGRGATR